jgi:DNA-binding transcriptional ArsR family regulator
VTESQKLEELEEIEEIEELEDTRGSYARRYTALKQRIFSEVENGMTATELQKQINRAFQTTYARNTISEALNSLYKEGKICKGRDKPRKTRGRPKVRWYLHPHYGRGDQ